MIVRKIALNGWRNYEFAAAEFSPGTNVITGENAQGKTNLLEAVYLLTGGKSFRTRFDKELIGFGYTSAEVLADVFAFGREQTVRIVLRQGQRKQIWQNGVKKTAAELAGTFAAVLFCPDDLNIIRDGPAARRRMMDNVPKADVVIVNPTHYAVALEYKMEKMDAPVVVAKGLDNLALRIREIAEEHDIPIVENPPLARALFASVELDQSIPAEHFKAVAEVIGYVMQLKNPQAR